MHGLDIRIAAISQWNEDRNGVENVLMAASTGFGQQGEAVGMPRVVKVIWDELSDPMDWDAALGYLREACREHWRRYGSG